MSPWCSRCCAVAQRPRRSIPGRHAAVAASRQTPCLLRYTRGEKPMTGIKPTRALAAHAAELRFEALPAALVTLIKQCVLDTLGVAIGATTLADEAKVVADYVIELG